MRLKRKQSLAHSGALGYKSQEITLENGLKILVQVNTKTMALFACIALTIGVTEAHYNELLLQSKVHH